MLEKLAGYKTYIALALLIAWSALYLKVPGAKEAIGADTFQLVCVTLLGAAGITLKAGQNRTEQKVTDLHEAVTDAAPKDGMLPPDGPIKPDVRP